MAYLSHGRPDGAELTRALSKVVENSVVAAKEFDAKELEDPDLYAGYPVIVNDLLKDNGRFCGLAHGWIEDITKREKIRAQIRIGILLATSVTPLFMSSLAMKFAVEVFDFVTYSMYIHSTYAGYQREYAKAFASLMGQGGLSS